MTKGEYPYPPDEFDAVDPSAGPRGAHRRPRGTWATLWPYLAALVASAVLAFVVIGLLWDDDTPPTALSADVPTGSASEPVEDPAATPGDPGADETPDPATTQAPVEPPVAEPSAPPPAPDLATPVAVFNSTSVQGLAAEAAETLEDAGWTRVELGNFTGTLDASTVRYGDPVLEVSARAVADELGIATVELAESDAVDGIEVVLELDFAG